MSKVSPEQAVQISSSIMDIMDNWKLSGNDILNVLALPKKFKVRHLGQFRTAQGFPDLPQVNERVSHIFGIANALRTSYPTNPQMGNFWLNQRSRRFQNRSPIQIIIEDDLEGLVRIRKHLDCSYDWHTDALAAQA